MKSIIIEDMLEDIHKKIDYVNSYVIEVGVMEDNKIRDKDKKSSKKIKSEEDGLTNAKLMFIHEYGSPANNIPSRPVLKYTIEDMYNKRSSPYHKFVIKIIDGILDKNWTYDDIDRELKILGEKVASYARNLINEGNRLKPNKPSTISRKSKKGKRSDIPLIDTGVLKRSITYNLRKIK